MKRKMGLLSAVLLIALTVMSSCSGGGGGGVNSTSTPPGSIGQAGGTISSQNGDATLSVPPGALTTDTNMAIDQTVDGTPLGTFMSSYALTSSGTLTFSTAVTISLRYDPSLIPIDVNENDLKLAYVSEGEWITIPASTVDTSNHIVTGNLTSLPLIQVESTKALSNAVSTSPSKAIVGISIPADCSKHGGIMDPFNSVNVYSNGCTNYNYYYKNEYNCGSGTYDYVSDKCVNGTFIGLEWECVEFVNRYYLSYYGKDIASPRKNAKDYYNTASSRGLVSYPNGGSSSPQIGDILVSEGDGSKNNVGHVAIVKEVTTDHIIVVHQNWSNSSNDQALNYRISRNGNSINSFSKSDNSYPIKGWLRLQSTYSMSGTIHSESNSGPVLSGATVSIAGMTATTDINGTFSITGIPAGTYAFSVSASGYDTYTNSAYYVGSDQADLNLYLTQPTVTYSMSGTIHSESNSGPALSGATVSIAGMTATTNSSGQFSISGIPAGMYTFSVSKSGYDTYTNPIYYIDSNQILLNFHITAVSSSLSWTGTKQLGVSGYITEATGVAVDSSGNVYVTGNTGGDLDGNNLTGAQDFFVTKYDPSGNKVRTKQLGVSGYITDATGVAVDSSGNVYVTGWTDAGLDGNILTGAQDFFVTKYDSLGNKVRTKQLGVSGVATIATGVAVDSSGNVYVAGTTSGGLDGNTLTGIGSDFFVTKYDSSGNKVRTKQLGVSGKNTGAKGVAVDSNGNVYVAGWTIGGLDGNTLTGIADFFVTKYDPSGNKVRTKQLGISGKDTEANGVAVDSSDNVYVAGYTSGGLDGNTLTGTADFFVTKYDPSGNKVRTKQLGASGVITEAYSVSVDSSDNVYVAGYTVGGLDGNTLAGTVDFFVTKYDPSGNKVRTKQLGMAGKWTEAYGVAVDSSDNVYVAGYTTGGLDGNTLTGTFDFFVTKYDSSGNKQ